MSAVSYGTKQQNLARYFKAMDYWCSQWKFYDGDGVQIARMWSFQPEHGVRRRPRNSPEESAPNYVVRLFLTWGLHLHLIYLRGMWNDYEQREIRISISCLHTELFNIIKNILFSSLESETNWVQL